MERLIDLEGCLNFRDLGGYPTAGGRRLAWRRIYRSDGLHRLTAADVVRLRDDLALTDLIDLRSTAELSLDGRGPLEDEPMAFHHVPLFDGDRPSTFSPDLQMRMEEMSLADRYFGLVEMAKEPIARVVELIADAKGGAVYHCAAGKDRTGVISAILLSVLGVPEELIVADYALSRQNLDAIIERLNASDGYKDMFEHLPPDTLHAEPETMVSLLAKLEEGYGSAEAFLESAGVGSDVVERLRASVLE
ncbi:MAG: tyrosine-protein phosphatase [Myxococcota bacterium]